MFKANWKVFNTPQLRHSLLEFSEGMSYNKWSAACSSSEEAQEEIKRLQAHFKHRGGVAAARVRAKKRYDKYTVLV